MITLNEISIKLESLKKYKAIFIGSDSKSYSFSIRIPYENVEAYLMQIKDIGLDVIFHNHQGWDNQLLFAISNK